VTAGRRCDGCPHAFHRDGCRGKAASGCVPLDGGGWACYRGARPDCPCPFGECHTCRAPIVGAGQSDPDAPEIDVDRGSAGDPAGRLAVRKLADGTLACRRLADGEQPDEGEWRGREHIHQLAVVSS